MLRLNCCKRLTTTGFFVLFSAIGASAQAPSGDVRLVPLDGTANFPEATAPDALSYACAETLKTLESYFAARNLPFERELVHDHEGAAACHIFYEPTIPGFRASQDNERIRELYFAADALSFLAGSDLPGGSLEVAKAVLPRLPRQIEVRMSVSGGFDSALWEPSARFHFSGIRHPLSLFESGTHDTLPWAQDHLKAGRADGQEKLLVPRRLFEGREDYGELFRPMLDALESTRFVRSKLSWEGGDLQFVAAPNDPSKTILAFGDTAKNYWGKRLSIAEYAYVLRVEFGADMTLDLTETGVHADYSIAFLPQDNLALLAQFVRRSPSIARAAAFELAETFGGTPPGEIRQLAAALADWDGEILTGKLGLRPSMDNAWRALKNVTPDIDVELDSLLTAYTQAHCPKDPNNCFTGSLAAAQMLKNDPELMRRATTQMTEDAVNAALRPQLLGIIANQLETDPWQQESALDKAGRQLEAWGFRVVRTPYISAQSDIGWPGIAYSNMLVFDKRLFVPAFGLGQAEERYFSRLRSDLRGAYEVIPIYARASLLRNGGIHCVFGIIREP